MNFKLVSIFYIYIP